MRTILLSAALVFVLAVIFTGPVGFAQGTAGTPASSSDAARSSSDGALVKTYCATCHNDRTRSGELSLENADLTNIPAHPELWEKVIRKVRAGMSNSNVHNHAPLPVLIAGGAAGRLKGGRHLTYPEGTPMSNLLLTILDKAGVRQEKVGDSTGLLSDV